MACTTAEIAHAFFVPEATIAQRISRAKLKIREDGSRFRPPPPAERAARLAAVLHVLYLIFNEGYTTSSGDDLNRPELTVEAVRLIRGLHELLPDDGEVSGLLALMLLTEARRPARTRPDGSLVPLAEQDRELWDADLIAEGVELITARWPRRRWGRISCRRRSPRSTTRRPAPRTPTGSRSSPSTGCSNGSRRARWSP